MFERFSSKSLTATAAALLAALGVGGAAMAQSSAKPTPKPSQSQGSTAPSTQSMEVPGQESTAPENSAADGDNIQQGDTGTAATATAAGSKADAPESAGDKANTGAAATDKADAGMEAPGSETAAGSDGPGGHADEPGSPNADHQAQGVE